VPATVPEAVDEVLEVAHYVTRRPGGNGAVRELCDLIRGHRR
jgi:3-deoxy-D-manno-octulosonate 8-phosphate phosphatase (KDO 8-P phosphatase)